MSTFLSLLHCGFFIDSNDSNQVRIIKALDQGSFLLFDSLYKYILFV